jgi:hypothetical protein
MNTIVQDGNLDVLSLAEESALAQLRGIVAALSPAGATDIESVREAVNAAGGTETEHEDVCGSKLFKLGEAQFSLSCDTARMGAVIVTFFIGGNT